MMQSAIGDESTILVYHHNLMSVPESEKSNKPPQLDHEIQPTEAGVCCFVLVLFLFRAAPKEDHHPDMLSEPQSFLQRQPGSVQSTLTEKCRYLCL